MLSELISLNSAIIVERGRARVRARGRAWPLQSEHEIQDGIPQFLSQLVDILNRGESDSPESTAALQHDALERGAALAAGGYGAAQVVHDYGDICQAITEVAMEQGWRVTAAEFRTLNGCLDVAMAEATTEFARLTTQRQAKEEVERLGQGAHDLRDALNSAMLAFHALKRGAVAINGSMGAVLGRSLTDIQSLIDRMVSQVRLNAPGVYRRVPVSLGRLFDEVGAVAVLHSEYRAIKFSMGPVAGDVTLQADPQLLASAIMNLVHNAMKNTPQGGAVNLSARTLNDHVLIEIADECGGIPEGRSDLFTPFTDRRGRDRSGLGLGLSIARRAVGLHGGEILVTNHPGTGCVFTIDLPVTLEDGA